MEHCTLVLPKNFWVVALSNHKLMCVGLLRIRIVIVIIRSVIIRILIIRTIIIRIVLVGNCKYWPLCRPLPASMDRTLLYVCIQMYYKWQEFVGTKDWQIWWIDTTEFAKLYLPKIYFHIPVACISLCYTLVFTAEEMSIFNYFKPFKSINDQLPNLRGLSIANWPALFSQWFLQPILLFESQCLQP